MSQLSNEDLKAVFAISDRLGFRIPAVNVHDLPQDFPRRREILMTLEASNPRAFARMAATAESAQPISVEAEMVKRGLMPMTEAAHGELMLSDGDYVEQQEQIQQQAESDAISSLDRMTAELERKRIVREQGSEAAADRFQERQVAQQAAREQQAEASALAHQQLEKRIKAKQEEIARNALISAGNVVATGVTG